jgi:gluconokinase
MIVLLMGVSGVGKSTVGRALAAHLSWSFHDADDLHSAENVARMASGRPLDDEARFPWLRAVRDLIRTLARDGRNAVVACSALKASYREVLLEDVEAVRVVHLTAPADVLRERVTDRAGHFMPSSLVESQVAALEPPADALTVDATRPVDDVVQQIVDGLDL